MRAFLSETIEDIGEIITVANGKKAKELLQTKPSIDLIITDIMMPEMNGYELVDYIKQSELYKRVPIIVLTARIVEEDKMNLLRIGVIDFLTKPFKSDELRFKVASLLELSQERRKQQIVIKQEAVEQDALIEKMSTYVFDHAHQTELSVDQLAVEFAMSRRTLYRFIESETGMSAAHYIREIRLNKARLLLQQEKVKTLEEVAAAVGYKSTRTFRLNYQERFGKHPLEEK
jgi:YesN/AraC family two-component response regulator